MKDLGKIKEVFRSSKETACQQVQGLMSAFIDSMATEDEVQRVEGHVADCEPCQRQLQGYISMKNLLSSVDEPEMPADLVLVTRVRLSRERNWNMRLQVGTRLSNVFKPIAIPAFAGVLGTVLLFSALMGSLLPISAKASDGPMFTPTALFKDVRTTQPTADRFAGASRGLGEPLTIETQVDGNGNVIHFVVLSGPNSPEVDRWLKELLYFAKFRPATMFGTPVESRLILSFVDVS